MPEGFKPFTIKQLLEMSSAETIRDKFDKFRESGAQAARAHRGLGHAPKQIKKE